MVDDWQVIKYPQTLIKPGLPQRVIKKILNDALINRGLVRGMHNKKVKTIRYKSS
jgi:hypothetical protein